MTSKKSLIPRIALLLTLAVFTQAYTCNTAVVESWVGIVLNAVSTFAPLISPLVGAIASLAGKTLTVVQVNGINNKLNQVTVDSGLLQALLASVQGMPDQTTLAKIQALETSISQNLNDAVLQANGVTDMATRTQILNGIQVLIGTIQQIEAVVPTLTNGRVLARKMPEKRMEQIKVSLTPAVIKARFAEAVHKKTGNADVDAAFGKIAVK